MSLINDALKRASQSDKNRPTQAALPRPMQPVATLQRTRISWLLAAALIAVIGVTLAGWFFWEWWETSLPVVLAAPIRPVQSVVAQPSPPPPLVEHRPAVATPTPTPVIPIAPHPVVKPSWPIALTVKAIFYSKMTPRALVNGRTVQPGDAIDGVVITEIEHDRVVVSWNGETKTLLLGGQ